MLKWNGAAVQELVKQAGLMGLSDGAEFLLDEANKIIPHDEGNLQRSGVPSIDEAKMTACVSYNTPYAKRLHENPQYNFQKGRKGKWLEIALKENAVQINQHIANKIKGVI